MLGRSRVASQSRGSSVIQSSWCGSIPLIVAVCGHMEEGGGVKKGLWDLFPFNTSRQPQLEPTLTTRVIASARSTGAQDCVDLLLPAGAECRVQLQDHLSGFGITSKWDSEKTEIHTPISNSTKGQWPSLPPTAIPSPPLPSPPLGVVMEWLTALEDGSHSGQLEAATGVDHLQHPMRKTTRISEQRGVCVTSKGE